MVIFVSFSWISQILKLLDPFYRDTAGFAYLPSYVDYDDALMGDVFIDNFYTPGDGYFEHLLTHEIGHAIGLSHPFDGLVNIDLKNKYNP